jgi:hypothetical protein
MAQLFSECEEENKCEKKEEEEITSFPMDNDCSILTSHHLGYGYGVLTVSRDRLDSPFIENEKVLGIFRDHF